MSNPAAASDYERKKSKFWQSLRLWGTLYLLVLPTVFSLSLFSYYPKIDVVFKSFFRWEPPNILEFIGLDNFLTALGDPRLWSSFKLVGILLVANLIKLWPGILAAIALHRLRNERLRYIFQVLFVVPMIIPMMVWLLIWKGFYEPELGLFNKLLNVTGLMSVLNWLDTAMPQLAAALQPIMTLGIDPLFGSLGGLFLFSGMILALAGRKPFGPDRWAEYGALIFATLLLPLMKLTPILGSTVGILTVALSAIGLAVFFSRRMQVMWIVWTIGIFAGSIMFWSDPWRLSGIMAASLVIYECVRRRKEFLFARPQLNKLGLILFGIATALLLLGSIWVSPTTQFSQGTPAWLGSTDLIIPALLFWGFPWVGTVGVLIYLSGLQNISQDVYEAAELDGVGPIGTLFHIELPLIMTQVRINLIFMTIGTLTAYEIFLILLGPEGGPGNKGMVPGLYMFNSAFTDNRFGYACALGMILFVIILTLTIIYQKYVKVDK